MNIGKTLFAQVMQYVPWKNFGRIIDRYGGDSGVRTLSCADLFRVMAFAQLTWRESLRDIEVCLSANQAKLFHMGMKGVPAHSTLADALSLRDCPRTALARLLQTTSVASLKNFLLPRKYATDLYSTILSIMNDNVLYHS